MENADLSNVHSDVFYQDVAFFVTGLRVFINMLQECGASITCNAMKSGAVCPGQ